MTNEAAAPRLRISTVVFGAALGLGACGEREPARQTSAPARASADYTPNSALIVGAGPAPQERRNPVSGNDMAIGEGRRLYDSFNCSGCHAGGGGGMGPPLMDSTWIYGNRPGNLFDVIVEGRPGGMPAFGSRLTETQIWQLVAYIESMGGMKGESGPARTRPDAQDGSEPGAATAAPDARR